MLMTTFDFPGLTDMQALLNGQGDVCIGIRVCRTHLSAPIFDHSTQNLESLPPICRGDLAKLGEQEGGLRTPADGKGVRVESHFDVPPPWSLLNFVGR
jgi:hypothetical protein